jgi:hypothetical protein
MPTAAIKEVLFHWEKVQSVCLEWHPNTADVSRMTDLFNNTIMHHFKTILKKRERQSTLDQFVFPVQAKRRREEVEQDKEDPFQNLRLNKLLCCDYNSVFRNLVC